MRNADRHPRVWQQLRAAVLTVAMMMAGLVLVDSASAEITEAPEIISTPSNPNTTHSRVTFVYDVGEGEASTADPIWFRCRQYPTDNPPASPTTGWVHCGRTNAPPLQWTYSPQNGSQTWEIAAAESQSGTRGPVFTYVWNQNIPTPSAPPIIAKQPENPTTLEKDNFTFEAPEGEDTLIQGFQCRLNSSDPEDWTNDCRVPDSNGTNTIEARAYNQAGPGPATDPITWTIDIPNPAPADRLTNSTTVWNGQAANDSTWFWENIGDINGDGRDDIATPTSTGSGVDVIDVVFGSEGGKGNRTFGTQGPSEGFRVTMPRTGFFGLGSILIQGVGDQNGDGIDDFIVQGKAYPPAAKPFTVVYGGFDVASLPTCGTGPTRCLSTATIDSPEEGFVLTGNNYQFTQESDGSADFDGVGPKELLFNNAGGTVKVVKGGPRTGTQAIDSLPEGEVQNISGLITGGTYVRDLKDLDGDGKSEILVTSGTGTSSVVYGQDLSTEAIDLTVLDPDMGFRVYAPAQAGFQLSNVGDADGDGDVDLAGGVYASLDLSDTQTVAVLEVPERGSDEYIVFGEPSDLVLYTLEKGDPNRVTLGESAARPIGDFNNDGIADFLSNGAETPVDGVSASGSAYVIFGQDPTDEPIGLGRSLTADVGVAILGSQGERAGAVTDSMGDLDGDGLGDFVVYAPGADPNGLNAAGAMYFVYGKSLINQVKTGNAAGVGNESAVLNAGLSTNNRDSEVWFEYGSTDEYGQTTEPQEFEASNTGDAASAAIDGLQKNTTYHYRAVARNELGLVRYGDDRTFTTTNADDPVGPSPCVADPTLPGCDKYDPCAADDTKPGCARYCEANPGKCNMSGPARLTVISITKKLALARGKRGTAQVAVINTGGKAAKGVKVCVRAPKRLVKVKRCTRVGSLGAGASRTVKIKVQAKKRRGKAVLNHTAKGNNVSAKKAKTRVVVR